MTPELDQSDITVKQWRWWAVMTYVDSFIVAERHFGFPKDQHSKDDILINCAFINLCWGHVRRRRNNADIGAD